MFHTEDKEGDFSLTFAEVCVDAHISGGASEALVFSVGNVFIGLRVNEFLGKAKVDDVYCVLVWGAIAPHEEIFRLHVTVYQVLAVHILNSSYLCE